MSEVLTLLPERLLEQIEPWTPWDRRAWEPGTALTLRELSEAIAWVPEGVLSSGSVDWFRQETRSRIGQDSGLAAGAVRQQLDEILRSPIRAESQAHRRFDELIRFLSKSYLENWREQCAMNPDLVNLERASRHISSHVIDTGYSPDWLRKKTQQLIRDKASALDILDEYIELTRQKPKLFDGFVLVHNAPDLQLLVKQENWVSHAETKHRLENAGVEVSELNFVGSLWFKVPALDERSAAEEVEERLQRVVVRSSFRRGSGRIEFGSNFYTRQGPMRFSQARRGIEMPNLTQAVYAPPSDDAIAAALDDALQLASPILSARSTSAVAGAWAAIESLLVTGHDSSDRLIGRAIAADRASTVVTASWPRAELTRLAYRVLGNSSTNPALKGELEVTKSAKLLLANTVLTWIERGTPFHFKDARDRCAELRMQALVRNPYAVLGRVKRYTTSSFRRLYRQRNMILHGGSVRPIGVGATLRTAGPLLGVVIDRLTQAHAQSGFRPLQAVAHAEVAIASTRDGTSSYLSTLSGP